MSVPAALVTECMECLEEMATADLQVDIKSWWCLVIVWSAKWIECLEEMAMADLQVRGVLGCSACRMGPHGRWTPMHGCVGGCMGCVEEMVTADPQVKLAVGLACWNRGDDTAVLA